MATAMMPSPWMRPSGPSVIPGRFYIDAEEWTHIITSIIVICVSLTFYNVGMDVQPGPFLFMMAVFAITVGSGFLMHELAHKYVAVRFGSQARFTAWTWGLLLMLALAIVPQVLWNMRLGLFLAPGAVMIFARGPIDNRQNGLISVAGPLMNIALAAVFFVAAMLLLGGSELGTTKVIDPTLSLVLVMGIKVNLSLAVFNLLPIFPLDGLKVLMWNWKIWLIMFTIALFGSGIWGF